MTNAGGEIEIHSAEYRGVQISLSSEDIRTSLMRGLLTPLSWHARPYLRQLDEALYEVTIGDTVLRLRNQEVRHLCQCVDHAVSIYKEDLIQTEDVLETWEYPIVEQKDFIGVCLLQIPLELWRLMHRFSQQFISPGNSEWHVFEPRGLSIEVGTGFFRHADLWALSPQSVYFWSVVEAADYAIVAYQLSDFYLPLAYVWGDTSRREWIHSVGEAGIWTAEHTKHWLLTKLIPKVLEYSGHRTTGEVPSLQRGEIVDLRLHRLSPAGPNNTEQLLQRVELVQRWSYGSHNLVRRELVLPYYESLYALATQSRHAKLNFGYIGGNLHATMHFLNQELAASPQPEALDDILAQLRFHVDRMRRETTEAGIRIDFMSRVFISVLEAKPKLPQKVLNELLRGVEPIWKEARFQRRHMG